MKNLLSLAGLCTIALLLVTCKKKDKSSDTPTPITPQPSPLPTVFTAALDSVTYYSVVTGGNVTSEGTSAITAVGVCWDTNPAPTTLKPHSNNGAGTGTFSYKITGLSPGVKYYIRAYATNGSGTAYGAELTITPPSDWNVVKTGLNYYSIASMSNTLFAWSSTVAARSTDGGQTWTNITTELGLTAIGTLKPIGHYCSKPLTSICWDKAIF